VVRHAKDGTFSLHTNIATQKTDNIQMVQQQQQKITAETLLDIVVDSGATQHPARDGSCAIFPNVKMLLNWKTWGAGGTKAVEP